jgi:uncharacterized protein (TIGR03435 family)
MRVLFFLVLFAAALPAQTFDVASVKRHVYENPNSIPPPEIRRVNATLRISGAPLAECIQWAYHIQSYQLVGGPVWILGRQISDRVDITAKSDTAKSTEEFRIRLQHLLADRFGLALHTESRALPSYIMTIDPRGLKVKYPDVDETAIPEMHNSPTGPRQMGFELKAVTTEWLCDHFSVLLQKPIVDGTGETRPFDANFSIELGSAADILNNLFESLRRDVGLAVSRSKTPLVTKVLVVDSVKPFSEN